MKELNLFIPLTKVDEEKRLVFGVATAEVPDKSGEVMDYESTVPYYKKWSSEMHKASEGKSYGNLREMHSSIAAGKITQLEFNDDDRQIEICAKVVDDSSWNKVLEGVLTGFSQGGRYVKTWKDPEDKSLTRYTADPSEVSLVDNPCVPTATFQVIKADGEVELRKFKTKETPMTETVIDGKPVQPKAEPEQVWKATDGQTFAKKDDWRKHQIELEAAESVTSVSAPALKAIEDLTKAIEDKESNADDPMTLGKREFSDKKRKELAESGAAMEDGSFPIETVGDLKNAIRAYGRAKDKEKAKAHIIARAKALGEESLIPDDWKEKKKADAGELRKSTHEQIKKSLSEAYDCQAAINALCTIECLLLGELGEEEDEPGQIADLKEAITRIKAFVSSEVMENPAAKADAGDLAKRGARHSAADRQHLTKAKGAVDEASDQLEDAQKHHAKMAGSHEAMRKCMEKMAGCAKAAGTDLAKAEEEHGKMSDHMDEMEGHLDKAEKHHGKIKKSHDAMEKSHGEATEHMKAIGFESSEKADDGELKKFVNELSTVKSENESLKTENDGLKKAFETINAQVPALIERVKKLEAQPEPAKGAVFDTSNVIPVKKGHEAQTPVQPAEVRLPHYEASPEQMRQFLTSRA